MFRRCKGGAVPVYRSYCLNGTKVVESDEYDAEDDAEALALFALRREKHDCELWCGDRKVATIPPGCKSNSGDPTSVAFCSTVLFRPTNPPPVAQGLRGHQPRGILVVSLNLGPRLSLPLIWRGQYMVLRKQGQRRGWPELHPAYPS